MLLMQIVSSLVRQWRVCGFVERVLVVCFVSGLVISLTASAFYGALIVAAAFGLLVLHRTGLLASSYQKAVGRALKPLYSLRTEERERDSNLLDFAEQLASVEPPYALHGEYGSLVRSLEELIQARESHLAYRDMNRYVVVVVALRGEANRWLQNHDSGKTNNDDNEPYVREIRGVINTYYAKDEAIAEQRHHVFLSAIANLQKMKPPARRTRVHRDAIEAITRMDELTTRQRACLTVTNELGVVATAAELAASRTTMENTIRQIRGLG